MAAFSSLVLRFNDNIQVLIYYSSQNKVSCIIYITSQNSVAILAICVKSIGFIPRTYFNKNFTMEKCHTRIHTIALFHMLIIICIDDLIIVFYTTFTLLQQSKTYRLYQRWHQPTIYINNCRIAIIIGKQTKVVVMPRSQNSITK